MSSSPPESPTIATANVAHGIEKPPVKPRTRSSYHLESNPFEVSFSEPSHRSGRPSSRDASLDSKPKLPPIAAIASPSAAADFSWAFGHGGPADVNSLRSGPLSPAMLAGPQYASHAGHGPNGAHHGVTNGNGSGFDVIRTGLTPDVSRTGLTPLIGGPASFPPPSPNTAAFIAMVTNQNNQNGNGAGVQSAVGVAPPATITPGTFSAITGALLNGSSQANNGNTSDTANNASSSPTHHHHPLSVSHGPHETDDAAHTAANGLFLLSQAHHELTKREDPQPAANQAQIRQSPAQAARNGTMKPNRANTTNSGPAANTKRKNTADPIAPVAKRARSTTTRLSGSQRANSRRKKSEDMITSGDEDEDDEMDGEGVTDDEELQAAALVGTVNKSGSKKPETEEEKRKNFLERNRQAALKCRQRKKAWLNQLQAKVEYLTAENDRLQNTTVSMREEISRLSAVVVAHRDCGLSGVSVARSEALLAGTADLVAPNRTTVNVSAAPSVSSNVASGNSNGGGGGVPSNAPSASNGGHGHGPASNGSNGGGMGNGAGGMSTRRRAAATGSGNSPVSQPGPGPQMVAVGGQSSRYGGDY